LIRIAESATIPRMVRLLVLAAILLTALPATAGAHAVVVDSSPGAGEILESSPAEVRLLFNEEIQLLSLDDADVRDGNGQSALGSRPFVDPENVRLLRLPLRPELLPGTYTVDWRVMGPDTHVVPGRIVFGVGIRELAAPIAVGDGGAPSETGFWAVSARTLHLAALGGLLGLLAFRWLVWRPVAPPRGTLAQDEASAVLEWGRDFFWLGFGSLALLAMVTEGYLLIVKSAIANGVDLLTNLQDPSGITRVLSDTRFGELVQLRGALLFVVFGTATWQFLSEFGAGAESKPATAVGRAVPALLMTALMAAILLGVAYSGHAAVAPASTFQIGVHTVHIAALAVWITGLVATAVALTRLPAVAPRGGAGLSARLLAALSPVAAVAVGVAFATGAIRAAAHLESPEQLVSTTYGRLILLKLALLVPIGILALRNRRIANALQRMSTPSAAALLMVRRGATAEIAVTALVIIAAGVLAAEVPGRN
jgi:copper transport protein